MSSAPFTEKETEAATTIVITSSVLVAPQGDNSLDFGEAEALDDITPV